jgi:ArsR family transcriptional regulator
LKPLHNKARRTPLGVTGLAILLFCVALSPAAKSGHGVEDDVETIEIERVKLLFDAGEEVFFVDLRPVENFRQSRLPGAVSIPFAELPRRFREIPKSGRVILYCDCTQNQLIEDAYQLLKDDYSYRNVALMIDGFAEWSRRKYPLENGPN